MILYCVISFSMLCLRVASSPPALAPVTPLQWSPRPQPGPHRNATHRCLPPAVSGHIQNIGFFWPISFLLTLVTFELQLALTKINYQSNKLSVTMTGTPKQQAERPVTLCIVRSAKSQDQ